jgi:hypothetical protein
MGRLVVCAVALASGFGPPQGRDEADSGFDGQGGNQLSLVSAHTSGECALG